MKIILLPGLDGSGLLFENLIKHIKEDVSFNVFSYERIDGSTYIEQAREIAREIGIDDVLLVGESYSGRTVYELNHILGEQVKGVVFLASFISRPSFISRYAVCLPFVFLKSNIFSRFFLHLFGFNLKGEASVVDPVFASLEKSNHLKLKNRLQNISKLTPPKGVFYCPAIYIQPTMDWFVGKKSLKVLLSTYVNCKLVNIRSGHFVAQSKPADCAEIICNAAATRNPS